MTCLHCENLTVGYEGAGVASGITFSVNGGDYLCVVGENGAGKSTLIKTLLGLQKPLAGSLTRSFATDDVGYLPQQTAIQKDFPATVEEIVQSGCLSRTGFFPFYRTQEKQR
ncbi:MAG: ATP-binding cassette domain-containing protein, partial [Treponemataceae bacterium]|nr:ATP-binding cassette domain-containing protein [Treponemataceae bacterium]